MKPRLLALTFAAAVSAAAPTLPAAAAVVQRAQNPAQAADQAVLRQATTYLQGLNSARGRFVQTDPNGAVTQGTFYLQRPGKVRFEYDKPSGLLVVADGSRINVSDQRLKTFDSYAQSQTPLSVFLGKSIELNQGSISRISRGRSTFSVTASDPRRRAAGAITLTFSNSPVALREWVVADAQGRQTRVRLTSITRASGLNPGLFVLRNPRAR